MSRFAHDDDLAFPIGGAFLFVLHLPRCVPVMADGSLTLSDSSMLYFALLLVGSE